MRCRANTFSQRVTGRPGHNDQSVGVVRVGPASHERQPLINGRSNPEAILLSLLGWGILIRHDKVLCDPIAVDSFVANETDTVVDSHVDQPTKHFSPDIMVPRQDHVALSARKSRVSQPTHCWAGVVPTGCARVGACVPAYGNHGGVQFNRGDDKPYGRRFCWHECGGWDQGEVSRQGEHRWRGGPNERRLPTRCWAGSHPTCRRVGWTDRTWQWLFAFRKPGKRHL